MDRKRLTELNWERLTGIGIDIFTGILYHVWEWEKKTDLKWHWLKFKCSFWPKECNHMGQKPNSSIFPVHFFRWMKTIFLYLSISLYYKLKNMLLKVPFFFIRKHVVVFGPNIADFGIIHNQNSSLFFLFILYTVSIDTLFSSAL